MAENEMGIIPHPNTDHLYQTIDSLLSTINIRYENKKVSDIEEAVCKYIKMLVDEVEKKEPQFRVSDILKVGSFNEGTKIIGPNEFDFLVVIDELSKPGAIVVERDSALPGNALLTFNDKHLKKRWGKYCVNGYLCCFQQHTDTYDEHMTERRGKCCVNGYLCCLKQQQTDIAEATYDIRIGTHDTFGSLVVEVISKMEGKRRSLRDKFRIDFDDIDNPNYQCKLSELNHIQLSKVEAKEPNVLLDFIVENCVISADLSPAIRYQPVEDCFNTEDCASSTLATSVINRGSILLVGKIGKEFRISFTETEVDYMKNKIGKKHKLLYMYLKYIMHLFSSRRTPMTSYMLKMICIRHDLECADIDKKLSVCFDEVISVIARCFEEENVRSVFNLKLSVWGFTNSLPKYRQHVLEAIRQISQLDLPNHPIEEFKLKVGGIVDATLEQYIVDCGTGLFN